MWTREHKSEANQRTYTCSGTPGPLCAQSGSGSRLVDGCHKGRLVPSCGFLLFSFVCYFCFFLLFMVRILTYLATKAGAVYTWGDNAHMQLGLGDTEGRSEPCAVVALQGHRIAEIACGEHHGVAVSGTANMLCGGCLLVLYFLSWRHVALHGNF